MTLCKWFAVAHVRGSICSGGVGGCLGGGLEGRGGEMGVDTVDGLLEAEVAVALAVVEKERLGRSVGCDVGENDACAFVGIRLPQGAESAEHVGGEFGGDSSRHGQGDGLRDGEHILLVEARGVGKERKRGADGVLAAQLLGAVGEILQQEPLDGMRVADGVRESACLGDRLLLVAVGIDDTGCAVEFQPREQSWFVEQVLGKERGSVGEIECSGDTCGGEFGLRLGTEAPHIGDGEALERLDAFVFGINGADTVVGGVLLGVAGGDFGEGFGGGDAERDGYADALADMVCELFEVGLAPVGGEVVDVEVGFVDGVLLERGGVLREEAHDAAGKVGVECEVGGESGNAVLRDERAYLIERHAHLNAERLGFVGARDDTAVVVGEDDDRSAFEVGVEEPLAGDEEIIAVAEGEHLSVGSFFS